MTLTPCCQSFYFHLRLLILFNIFSPSLLFVASKLHIINEIMRKLKKGKNAKELTRTVIRLLAPIKNCVKYITIERQSSTNN